MEIPKTTLREATLDSLSRHFEKNPGVTIRQALEKSLEYLEKSPQKGAFDCIRMREYEEFLSGKIKIAAHLDQIFDLLPFHKNESMEFREMKNIHINTEMGYHFSFQLEGLTGTGPSYKTSLEGSWDVERSEQTWELCLSTWKEPKEEVKIYMDGNKLTYIPIQNYKEVMEVDQKEEREKTELEEEK